MYIHIGICAYVSLCVWFWWLLFCKKIYIYSCHICPSIHPVVGKQIACVHPNLSRERSIHIKLFSILHGRFVSFPSRMYACRNACMFVRMHIFFHLSIYLYQYRLMDIYFIVIFYTHILSCLLVGSCVPLTRPHHCGFFFFLLNTPFLVLPEDPGSSCIFLP